MALPRCVASSAASSASLTRLLSICPVAPRQCLHASRSFSSSRSAFIITSRRLQTATAHHPKSFDSQPPPPRNSGVPDTSIAGGVPEVNDTRPPRFIGEFEARTESHSDEKSSVSISEGEAQKAKPTTANLSPTSTPTPSPSPAKPRQRKLRPRKAAMTLSSTAVEQLRNLLSQPEPRLIRVGVKNRGCSGLAYHLEYVEKPGTFDETVEQDGVKVLIDSKALFSIIGSEMDWVEDKLNRRFVFRNPNIKEQCGCGESFMV
ncbi:hypothetical protein L228DRAFT_250344 [Xylona heveae TC161]|uniref:Iron-sulfur assembly protein 1 n=1 Tax=Xylona heveae (strain CBS 132557 / TC161) TaxID=1328760 RepID=A0A165A483_XYLHT|nr:hypothetical protein L228DRAFT_250344 [Xylona heveae TC161]KZF19929.1 hypothetical protein L228DRAFT_250344 [Xylona heveae TC161]